MPEMAAVKLPGAPELPTEHAATLRAPSTTARTIPTPAAGTVAVASPQAPPSSTLPPLSEDPETAVKEALRRRAESAETELAELKRQARVQAESEGPGPYQAPIGSTADPAPVAPTTGAQGERGERGKPSSKLAQLPAILLGAAGLVTALGTAFKPDTSKQEAAYMATQAAYTALREEIVRTNKAVQTNADNDDLRWNFTVGLFKATGDVKVTEAPGVPKIEPLAVLPAPLTNKVSPGSAPAVQIRDTLPPPVPSVAPVRLPMALESLRSDKSP